MQVHARAGAVHVRTDEVHVMAGAVHVRAGAVHVRAGLVHSTLIFYSIAILSIDRFKIRLVFLQICYRHEYWLIIY